MTGSGNTGVCDTLALIYHHRSPLTQAAACLPCLCSPVALHNCRIRFHWHLSMCMLQGWCLHSPLQLALLQN